MAFFIKERCEMTCPDSVRSRMIAPSNHRCENLLYALLLGEAFWSAGRPVSYWVRVGSSHLLHNIQSEVALNWCKPVRRATAWTHVPDQTVPRKADRAGRKTGHLG